MSLEDLKPNSEFNVESRMSFLESLGVKYCACDFFKEDIDGKSVSRFFDYLRNNKRVRQDKLSFYEGEDVLFKGGGKERVIGVAYSEGDLYFMADKIAVIYGVSDFNAEVRIIHDLPKNFSDLVRIMFLFCLVKKLK